MNPLRLCLFTPTFLPNQGGAERMADTIVRALQQRGHTVAVLAQHAADRAADRAADAALPYPVRRYHRPPAQHLWPSVVPGLALRSAHRAWNFDAVLSFYAYPTGYTATRLAKKLGFRVVVSPRGGDLYPNFHSLKKPFVKQTIADGYRHADRIASISDWLTQRIETLTGQTRNTLPPIDAVPNGIDLETFDHALKQAQNTTLPLQPPFLLHLARLHQVKRHDLALQAIANLADDFRARNIRYAIAGDGPEKENLQQQINQHNLADIVQLLGHCAGSQKPALLGRASAMVSTSREEGMPNTILEAMAAGLPTLASDIGPHRELIENHTWASLFRAGDADHLTEKLAALLANTPTQQAAMRKDALQLRQQYTLQKTIDGYEHALYEALK